MSELISSSSYCRLDTANISAHVAWKCLGLRHCLINWRVCPLGLSPALPKNRPTVQPELSPTCPPCEVRKSGRHLHKSVIGPGWKRPSTMFTSPKNKCLLFLSLETLVGFWAGLWFKPLQSLHHVGQGFAQAPPTSSRTFEILKNLRHSIQPASGEFHRPTPDIRMVSPNYSLGEGAMAILESACVGVLKHPAITASSRPLKFKKRAPTPKVPSKLYKYEFPHLGEHGSVAFQVWSRCSLLLLQKRKIS